ncbi:hypothetical protein FACS1894109_08930 [Spirochaetia bacterium]|nr:hypothetical protein FACS1894109_08930 [Spirochaetia bacterium]
MSEKKPVSPFFFICQLVYTIKTAYTSTLDDIKTSSNAVVCAIETAQTTLFYVMGEILCV